MKKTSWVTLARPFAKRRRFYRRKAAKHSARGDFPISHENYFASEAITYMWFDFTQTPEFALILRK